MLNNHENDKSPAYGFFFFNNGCKVFVGSPLPGPSENASLSFAMGLLLYMFQSGRQVSTASFFCLQIETSAQRGLSILS